MLRCIARNAIPSVRPAWAFRRRLHLSKPLFLPVLPVTSTTRSLHQARPGLQLRDYQEECVQTVLRSLEEGRRQVGVSLATGSGKTVIFTELVSRVPPPTENATQTLILVHRRELVEQAARHCSARYPDKTVDIEMGSMRASGHADITIASVQSITSKDRIDKFDPDHFKLILVDEAHHIVAGGYLRVLDYFGLQSDEGTATPALVGVSATFARFDGLALGKAIKHIVYHKDYIDMIGAKWLSDVIFTTVESKADISRVKKSATGDFLSSSLSSAVNNDETNLVTVRAWQERAHDRKSTLVFCVDLAHVESLTKMFRTHGVDARFVTGDTPKVMRAERLEAFKRGEFPVLLNCSVFTEGTDIPNIDCVLLARPTKSRNLLVQMIGRGMRLNPGKKNCQVIDMVASLERGIVTTPTLFGLDPSEILVSADPDEMKKTKERREREKLREQHNPEVSHDPKLASESSNRILTFRDYDSVNDLIDETSGERFIRAISPNAWVNVGDERFILTNGPSGSYLSLEKLAEGDFEVKVINRLPSDAQVRSPFTRPRKIVNAHTFESAVHGADTFAGTHFNRAFIISHGMQARWREGAASQAQVDYLNKFRDDDDQLTMDDITKGKAGDMIMKIKFGARGRFKAMKTMGRKKERWQTRKQQEEKRQENEVVQVGPLKDG